MRTIRLTLSRNDCLIVDSDRDWIRMSFALAGIATAAIAGWRASWMTPVGKATVVIAALVFAGAVMLLVRATRRWRRILVKSPRGLLLDGDPLELARLELRLVSRPTSWRNPRYELSLWVMTLVGPEELPLGSFATLADASRVSGELEDFLQKGSLKPHRVT